MRHLSNRRAGWAAALAGTLLIAGAPSAVVAAAPATGAGLVFYTPVDAQTVAAGGGASSVHLMLGAGPEVLSIHLQYSTDGTTWLPIGGRTLRGRLTGVFERSWMPPTTVSGPVQLRAGGYDATEGGTALGDPIAETVTLSPTGTHFAFTRPTSSGAPLGVFSRVDGRWFAAVSGTTSSSVEPTAVDAAAVAAPVSTPPPAPPALLPEPTGVFPVGAASLPAPYAFSEPVDLSASVVPAGPGHAAIRVSDGVSSDAVAASLYAQKVGAVRATTAVVPGTSRVTVGVSVTDQYGLPVVGAPLRLAGAPAGPGTAPVSQLGVSDAAGRLTFTGPGLGTGPVAPTGYPTGSYLAYADLDLNARRAPTEPIFTVVVGTVSFGAPGKAFYHSDRRIKIAGGVYADAPRGTIDARAKGYRWIDQDGQISYRNRALLKAGPRRISRAAELVWVNAHGAPYNPRWLGKKGRFENKAWGAIRKHRGLRDAALTFQQNARYGLSVEWEVKNIRPFDTPAALKAAFANLRTAAKRYYGPAWASRVQVKMLSNLTGGQAFALKVLKVAHSYGFTTLYLARGRATKSQIPASAQSYVTYVRGAKAGLYPATPPASQSKPVVVKAPPVPR